MRGQYLVKRPLKNEVDFNLTVLKMLNNEIPITLGIKPNNRMRGQFDIFERPRVKQELPPIKDSYVYESAPTFNYGNKSQMRVGVDDSGKRFRSFLLYDLTQLKKNLNIISVKLKLTTSNPSYTIDMFEISTANKDYNELGLTWSNQPSRDKFIDIIEVDKSKEIIEIDVTDIVKEWYANSRINNGFILKEFETALGKMISFYTKESDYPPILEVEYFDPTFGLPRTNYLDFDFTILQNQHNEIPIRLDVITYKRDSDLPFELLPISQIGELYIELRVTNTELPVEVTVQKKLDDNIPLEFSISESRISEDVSINMSVSQEQISIEFATKLNKSSEIEITIDVKNENLPIYLNVNKPILPVEFNIFKLTKSEIDIDFSVSQDNLNLELQIIKSDYIPLTMAVISKPDNIDQYLPISFSYSQRSLPIQLEVRKFSDLPIEISIPTKVEKDIELLVIKRLYSEINIDSNIRAVSQIPIEMNIRSRFLDLELINLKRKQTFKNLEVNVRSIEDLPLEVKIRKTSSILVDMRIKKFHLNEIIIKMIVDSDNRIGAYAFIM